MRKRQNLFWRILARLLNRGGTAKKQKNSPVVFNLGSDNITIVIIKDED